MGRDGTHRGDLQEAVGALGEVGEARDPAELALELLQEAAGVEQLGLEGAQELVVAAGEALGQAQGVLELLPQRSPRGVRLRAVCGARGTLSASIPFVEPPLPPRSSPPKALARALCVRPPHPLPKNSPTARISRHFSHSSRSRRQPAELRRISRHTMRSLLEFRDSAGSRGQRQGPQNAAASRGAPAAEPRGWGRGRAPRAQAGADEPSPHRGTLVQRSSVLYFFHGSLTSQKNISWPQNTSRVFFQAGALRASPCCDTAPVPAAPRGAGGDGAGAAAGERAQNQHLPFPWQPAPQAKTRGKKKKHTPKNPAQVCEEQSPRLSGSPVDSPVSRSRVELIPKPNPR